MHTHEITLVSVPRVWYACWRIPQQNRTKPIHQQVKTIFVFWGERFIASSVRVCCHFVYSPDNRLIETSACGCVCVWVYVWEIDDYAHASHRMCIGNWMEVAPYLAIFPRNKHQTRWISSRTYARTTIITVKYQENISFFSRNPFVYIVILLFYLLVLCSLLQFTTK